jgi:uncharacterized damage-inducible protein DinB/heme-degrading monooxygenase HmoA
MKKSAKISRIWHGKTPRDKGESYLDVLLKTGAIDYAKASGNTSIKILKEDREEESHFWVITEWKDFESIKEFAGENYEIARYYAEDDDYLLEKEKTVTHCETYPIKGELDQLTGALEDLFSGNNWVAISVSGILESIDFPTSVEKKLPGRHSILEIVQHSLAWRDFLIRRLRNDDEFDIKQNDENDWKKNERFREEMWEDLKKEFVNKHKLLIELLKNHDDRLLDRKVAKRDYTFRYLISGIINHDYYHFGQVSILG